MKSELDNFDQRLRKYYASQSLSGTTLTRLTHTIRTTSRTSGAPSVARLKPWVIIAGVCSSLAVVGVIALLVLALWHSPADDVARLAAGEVATNHHKQLAVEFSTADVSQLREQMSKLDFSLVMPQRFQDGRHRLVGGRYCSIRGQIAAQLRLVDAHGYACTLYEVRPVDALASVSEGRFEIDGCEVELWKDNGLLMVLARAPHR